MNNGLSGVPVVASHHEGPLKKRYLKREAAILGAEGVCVPLSLQDSYYEKNRLRSQRGLRIVRNNISLQSNDTITSEPIDGPLLELLEFDLGGRRGFVEAQPMGIILLLVLGNSKLLLFMIVDITSS